MRALKRLFNWLREPWLTTQRATLELHKRWPNKESRIVIKDGRVKIYLVNTLMTNQPTLKQAIDQVRKYYPVQS